MTRIEDDRLGRKKLGHYKRYIIALFLRSKHATTTTWGAEIIFLRFGKTINCHSVVWNWQILITRIEDDRLDRKKLGHFMRYIIALFLRSNALQAPVLFNISCLKETLIPKPTSVTNRLIFNIWLKNNYSALIRWLFNKSKPSSINYERQNVSAPFFNTHNNIRSLLLTSSFRLVYPFNSLKAQISQFLFCLLSLLEKEVAPVIWQCALTCTTHSNRTSFKPFGPKQSHL